MKKNFYINYFGVIGIFVILVFSSYGCAHKIYYFKNHKANQEKRLDAGHRTVKSQKNQRYLFVEKDNEGSAVVCLESPPFSYDLKGVDISYGPAQLVYSQALQQAAVSEILKVAYYNLCQATANGHISKKQYQFAIERLTTSVQNYVVLTSIANAGTKIDLIDETIDDKPMDNVTSRGN